MGEYCKPRRRRCFVGVKKLSSQPYPAVAQVQLSPQDGHGVLELFVEGLAPLFAGSGLPEPLVGGDQRRQLRLRRQ